MDRKLCLKCNRLIHQEIKVKLGAPQCVLHYLASSIKFSFRDMLVPQLVLK